MCALRCVHCVEEGFCATVDINHSGCVIYVDVCYFNYSNCPDDSLKVCQKADLAEDTINLEYEAETVWRKTTEKVVR
jgi:hypothetical protein